MDGHIDGNWTNEITHRLGNFIYLSAFFVTYRKMLYDGVYIVPEFGNSVLKSKLEVLNNNGWHADKQSLLSQHSPLSEEELEPLLEQKQYFKTVNDNLLKLLRTAPILDLVEIDTETVAKDKQPNEDSSMVATLINKMIKESSSKVLHLLCI